MESSLKYGDLLFVRLYLFLSYVQVEKKKRISREDARRLYNIAKCEKEEVLW